MTHVVRLTVNTHRFLKHFEQGPLRLMEVQRLEKNSDPKAGSERRSAVSLRYAIAIHETWLRRVPVGTNGPLDIRQDTAELTDYGRQRLADDQPTG